MEIKKFEIEFVKRTKELLQYKGPRGMSNLINCTLGLIILPYETIRKDPASFWNTKLDKIADLPSFNLPTFKPIKKIKNSNVSYYPKTLKVLLQKIRNGLAHQNIKAINENGKFVGVIIKNYFDNTKHHLDLEAHFSQEELKSFALFIANTYLKNMSLEKNCNSIR